MVLMWATPEKVSHPVVEYWATNATDKMSKKASSTSYQIANYTSPHIHTVKIKNLRQNTTYSYRVGDSKQLGNRGWSSINRFKTEPAVTEHPFTFLAMADHGTSPNSTELVQTLLREMDASQYKLIIHSGDISYANGDQPIWDDWFQMVSQIAAIVPWQTAPGNHEQEHKTNFLAYRKRFTMPWKESSSEEPNMFHSFNYENVHFIALNSERSHFNSSSREYRWLEKDLQKVDRTKTPWVFTFFHTPWYCTNTAHLQEGAPMREGMEDLFFKYKVDIVFTGHVHAYERTVPIYKGVENPLGPVYITNGAGGTEEGLANTWIDKAPWTAFRQSDSWGIGLVKVYNATHLSYEFKESHENKVLDSVWIVRQRN